MNFIKIKNEQLLIKINWLFALILCISCEEPDATEVAKSCTTSDLVSQCPVGTVPQLNADSSSACNTSSSINIEEGLSSTQGSGSIDRVCVGSGNCQLVCELSQPCLYGIKELSKDRIACNPPVACGNGSCEVGENPMECPEDCGSICTPLVERCNGKNREVCNNRGSWDTLNCDNPTACVEIENQKTQCQMSTVIIADMSTPSDISLDIDMDTLNDAMIDIDYGIIDQKKNTAFFKNHINQGVILQNNNEFKLKSTITTMQFKSKNTEYQLRSTLNP